MSGTESGSIQAGNKRSYLQTWADPNDRVRGVDDLAHGRGERQERGEPLPGPLPDRDGCGVLAAQLALTQGQQRHLGCGDRGWAV